MHPAALREACAAIITGNEEAASELIAKTCRDLHDRAQMLACEQMAVALTAWRGDREPNPGRKPVGAGVLVDLIGAVVNGDWGYVRTLLMLAEQDCERRRYTVAALQIRDMRRALEAQHPETLPATAA